MAASETRQPRAPGLIAAAAASLLGSATAFSAPAIRTGPSNSVPACVTPDRLMAFLAARNPSVDRRFAGIANDYKRWGEAWRVRWDYAFFQMAIETNYLSYRRGDGRRGDVHETQNNFAGIGATGRGAPGDRFADVSTGVHAQIQHLVAYSGERLAQPIAPRTALKQDDIVSLSQRLNRPVTFGDLARRWAVDRHYARSIDYVAGSYRDAFCRGDAASAETLQAPQPQPARRRAFPPPAGLGGPKPSALAGPQTEPLDDEAEVLPWAIKPTPTPAAEPARRSKPEKATAPRVTSTPPIQGQIPAQAPIIPKAEAAPHSPVRTIWARDDAATEPAPAPAETAATTTEATGGFTLPLFRIAPYTPEPSRLGGPIPDLREAASAATAAAEPECRVLTATYGGRKTLLVRATVDGQTRLTALTVLDGFEKSMFETYARASAPGAEIVGEYATQDAALADARVNCPDR